ncbi:hypothetical protein LUZ60_008290 [Juncus effusus]|nr:hypothetical protein LUZ60_008290 [Juncus effusus]
MMSGGGYTSINDHNGAGSVPSAVGAEQVPVHFANSNLQNFPPVEPQGKIPISYRPPQDADDTFSGPGGSGNPDKSTGWLQLFTVEAYKPYFDVDTSDVLERIRDSLFPFNGNFNEKTTEKPDLYGPFWISTTLIFAAAAIGTFVAYFEHKWHKKEWAYDINLVTWSAGLFYGYVTLVPLVLFLVLKYFSAPSGLVQLWCLYGYSLFVFIPASCLSIIPLEIFRWLVVSIAGFMSAAFVSVNLKAHIVSSAGEKWVLIVSAIFLLQLALAVVLKVYFFTITVSSST